jgi:hypothetical protein
VEDAAREAGGCDGAEPRLPEVAEPTAGAVEDVSVSLKKSAIDGRVSLTDERG